MYRILTKDMLTPTICRMKVEAPRLARAAQPGQFLIIRADEQGERVPLTISDFDRAGKRYVFIAGRTVTIDSLLDDEGFDAVFVGSGAGLPRFMNIPGEHFNGVFSANEFLTRNNLMKAYHRVHS